MILHALYPSARHRQVFGPVAVRPVVVLAIERQQRSATPRRCPPPTRRRCAGGAGAHKTTINHTSVGVRGREEDMLAAEGRNRDQKRSWEDDMMPSRRRLLFIYHLDGARSRRPASGCAQNKTTINSVRAGGKRRGKESHRQRDSRPPTRSSEDGMPSAAGSPHERASRLILGKFKRILRKILMHVSLRFVSETISPKIQIEFLLRFSCQ